MNSFHKDMKDGTGLTHYSASNCAGNWLTRPGHIVRLSGIEFVSAIHTRLNCFATHEQRGRPQGEVSSNRCRICPDCVYSLKQVCAATHEMQMKRHHDVMEMIARKSRFPLNNSLVKTYIVAWMADDLMVRLLCLS